MVNQVSVEQLNDVFGALSDPTRRRILSMLAEGESTVKQVALPFSMSLPAISKHLRVLEQAGLITRKIEGRTHRLTLEPRGLRTAAEWVEHYRRFWEGQLDNLAAFLEAEVGRVDHRSARHGIEAHKREEATGE